MRMFPKCRTWLAVIVLAASIGGMGSVARADVTLYGSWTGANNGDVLNTAPEASSVGATDLTVTFINTAT